MTTHTNQWYMQTMGIQTWSERGKISDIQNNSTATELGWDELREQVLNCKLCDLHKTRTHAVFGVGNRQADLLVIGEAPGAEEDKKGEPFVGRAGKLLDEMLKAIGLNREIIYIANILKSRPPNNRDPKPEEVARCTPYLHQQIKLIQPKLILAVGRIAAHFLLESNESLGKMRQKKYNYGKEKTPLIVTYHPAYLLRNPIDKRKAYEDLLWVKNLLVEGIDRRDHPVPLSS